jgi:hypothetical protein
MPIPAPPVGAGGVAVSVSAVAVPVPVVGAAVRPHGSMKACGIPMGVTCTAVAVISAGRGVVGATAAEVTARGMPAAADVAARSMPAAPAAASMPAAVRLGQYGGRACQDRPQYAGRQKKAPALGTHDCHLTLNA